VGSLQSCAPEFSCTSHLDWASGLFDLSRHHPFSVKDNTQSLLRRGQQKQGQALPARLKQKKSTVYKLRVVGADFTLSDSRNSSLHKLRVPTNSPYSKTSCPDMSSDSLVLAKP
jgi:hypothetical protein